MTSALPRTTKIIEEGISRSRKNLQEYERTLVSIALFFTLSLAKTTASDPPRPSPTPPSCWTINRRVTSHETFACLIFLVLSVFYHTHSARISEFEDGLGLSVRIPSSPKNLKRNIGTTVHINLIHI
ncbi:hypothetical protein BDN72DRAFT_552897 [Pluteus cervinus]|uniref:Uncharacterized protein n=1 Tax=Pluteus cervinus TaxID=181527 RepID=A0ACD3AW88_9AGAR|nr:hypothetical protein BDN72DRAFT_552897 [Pluteus cervinus]